jgi:hypothetical protein
MQSPLRETRSMRGTRTRSGGTRAQPRHGDRGSQWRRPSRPDPRGPHAAAPHRDRGPSLGRTQLESGPRGPPTVPSRRVRPSRPANVRVRVKPSRHPTVGRHRLGQAGRPLARPAAPAESAAPLPSVAAGTCGASGSRSDPSRPARRRWLTGRGPGEVWARPGAMSRVAGAADTFSAARFGTGPGRVSARQNRQGARPRVGVTGTARPTPAAPRRSPTWVFHRARSPAACPPRAGRVTGPRRVFW